MLRSMRSKGNSRRGRALAVLTGTVLVVASVALLAFPASAHSAEISANCDHVTVNLTGFPDQGTEVHIAVQVGDVGSTSKDVNVGAQDETVTVPISSLTAQLNGESANVVVDVTWDYFGQPQHQHESVPVTCGEKTSTSVSGESSTSIANTSTSSPMTVTTVGNVTSSVASNTTENSTSASSSTISPVTALSTPGGSAGPTSEVSGTSATSLPFTGGAAVPLLVLGIALVLAGAGFTVAQRQRS
jgi:hypothetical protein